MTKYLPRFSVQSEDVILKTYTKTLQKEFPLLPRFAFVVLAKPHEESIQGLYKEGCNGWIYTYRF